MKLIGSLTSPYVRKVRVVLAEKKLDYKFELDNVWGPDSRILDTNPLGKVPCLVMEDGSAIFDSRVIVEYLDGLSPNAKLIPPNGRSRLEVRVLEALGDGVCDAAVAIRLESLRAPEKQDEAVFVRNRAKLDHGVAAFATSLGDKPWFSGVTLTLGDVAAGVALGYLDFRMTDLDWRAAHPNLGRWFDKFAKRQSFIDTAPPAA
ncbi:glutathione S-transferase N-terminal domain-containing protein [Derxia lacustris]|uniref:glutathione S-transferase N-terminal domain-containing protein n=1 Tax=Derxia lacustris TaxID=764842 RepID=UPI000A175182|nr:glutathione S-transferase N-terminal domain-containing protein [Derxia lacustris]